MPPLCRRSARALQTHRPGAHRPPGLCQPSGRVSLTTAHPKRNLHGTAQYIHTLQPNELSLVIVIAVITKGISNDKRSRVKALEAKEPSDKLKCWQVFSQLRAMQYLPRTTNARRQWVRRAPGTGNRHGMLWAASVPMGMRDVLVHKTENRCKRKEKGQVCPFPGRAESDCRGPIAGLWP